MSEVEEKIEEIEVKETKEPKTETSNVVLGLLDEMDTEKERYENAIEPEVKEEEESTASENTETAQDQQQQPANDIDPDKYKRNARGLITVFDMMASFFLGKMAGDSKANYKLTETEIDEMVEPLAEGLQEMGIEVEMPWYVKLGIPLSMAYWGRWQMAKTLQQENKKVAAEEAKKYSYKHQQQPVRAPQRPQHERTDVVDEQLEEIAANLDKPPSDTSNESAPSVEKGIGELAKTAVEALGSQIKEEAEDLLYWGEKGNPIEKSISLERQKAGNTLCIMCEENYCKKGKTVCGTACAGRRTSLVHKNIEPNKQNYLDAKK